MFDYKKEIGELEAVLKAGVSPFHTILNAKDQLHEAGFEELELGSGWDLQKGKGYYVDAFSSTLIAFTVPEDLSALSLRLAASHTDWPCLKVKPSPEVTTKAYGKLNVEVYGGAILNTWLDRPLSLAGRVCVPGETPFHPVTKFIDFKRPLLTVPNLAIHLNREVNNGVAYNPQVDMLPLITMVDEKLNDSQYFLKLLADEAGVKAEDILDYEFYIYNCDEPQLVGINEEFYSAPRLDNLTSVHACLSGITSAERTKNINISALYDNEEIGSSTKQGAASGLLDHIMEKIFLSLGLDRNSYLNALFNGFLLSMDVAQSYHPNKTENFDIKNQVLLNDGIAIKLAASQAYATDATSTSIIEALCRENQIPYKKYSNRSNIKGGSTLGSISSAMLTMRTVDIGVPLLAMHSARELMGTKDQAAIVELTKAYFQS